MTREPSESIRDLTEQRDRAVRDVAALTENYVWPERGGAEVVSAVEAALGDIHATANGVTKAVRAALADPAGALAKHDAELLRAAADEWDDPERIEELRALASEKYHAGGPSMPAIWLRERADRIDQRAEAEEQSYDCLRCGRRVMRGGAKTEEGWFHLGCHRDDEIQRRQAQAQAEAPAQVEVADGWICEVCGCWNRDGDLCKYGDDEAHQAEEQ